MSNIILFLCIIILFGLFVLMRHLAFSKDTYGFQNKEIVDMPYITIDIQGEKFNMITDSAASVSIIKRDALSRIASYENSNRIVGLSALTNDAINSDVVIIPIQVNGKDIKSDFVVYDSNDIADFSSKYGITIDGVLGVEFFKKTGGIVNFNKHTVTFP